MMGKIRPTVKLNEKGVEVELPLKLSTLNLSQLETLTGLGVPMGVIQAVRDGKVGVGFCADVITLGLRHLGRRPQKVQVIEAMEGFPLDEYIIPCLQAVCVAAGRTDIAEELEGGDGSIAEEKEKAAPSLSEGGGEGNPMTERET